MDRLAHRRRGRMEDRRLPRQRPRGRGARTRRRRRLVHRSAGPAARDSRVLPRRRRFVRRADDDRLRGTRGPRRGPSRFERRCDRGLGRGPRAGGPARGAARGAGSRPRSGTDGLADPHRAVERLPAPRALGRSAPRLLGGRGRAVPAARGDAAARGRSARLFRGAGKRSQAAEKWRRASYPAVSRGRSLRERGGRNANPHPFSATC
jgi:hypothetical protein